MVPRSCRPLILFFAPFLAWAQTGPSAGSFSGRWYRPGATDYTIEILVGPGGYTAKVPQEEFTETVPSNTPGGQPGTKIGTVTLSDFRVQGRQVAFRLDTDAMTTFPGKTWGLEDQSEWDYRLSLSDDGRKLIGTSQGKYGTNGVFHRATSPVELDRRE